MRIEIEGFYDQKFIKEYLPKLMGELITNSVDDIESEIFRIKFGIDLNILLKKVSENILVKQIEDNKYIIEIDKNAKWKKYFIYKLVDVVTYGNRSAKGYPLIRNVFSLVNNYIDVIYKEWCN